MTVKFVNDSEVLLMTISYCDDTFLGVMNVLVLHRVLPNIHRTEFWAAG